VQIFLSPLLSRRDQIVQGPCFILSLAREREQSANIKRNERGNAHLIDLGSGPASRLAGDRKRNSEVCPSRSYPWRSVFISGFPSIRAPGFSRTAWPNPAIP